MPPDESIVPRRNVRKLVEGKDWDYTPVLRADATDDVIEDVVGVGESGTEYALGGSVTVAGDLGGSVVMPSVMVCPVCGLESCGHNLNYVEKSE